MSLQNELQIDKPSEAAGGRARSETVNLWLEKRIRAGIKAVFSERVTLTPDLAQALLERNDCNRRVRVTNLAQLVFDIQNGNWRLNGETIIVSSDGKMNDGQHRCMAVVETGHAVETIIAFGVARDTRTTVDTGSHRQVGDFLSMDGAQNAFLSAAVAKMVWQFERFGQIWSDVNKRPTQAETQKAYWENAIEIANAIKGVPKAGSQKLGHLSMVAFAMFLLRKKDADAAKTYIEALCKGTALDETSPIYLARERLADPASRRLKTAERLEIVLRHWNAWRRKQRMKKPSPLQGELPAIED